MKTAMLRLFGSMYPLYSGHGRIAFKPLFANAAKPLGNRVTQTLRDGTKIVLDPQDFFGRTVYFMRDWDPKVTWAVRSVLDPGHCMLDIGAHCGLVSLTAANRVGPSGQVHAFEPQPALAGLLGESIEANGFRHLTVHNVALSTEAGQMEMLLAWGRTINASFSRRLDTGGTTINVEVKQASDYLLSLDLPPVRLLKIDVEGHEHAVFTGGERFLTQNKPQVILFESDDDDAPPFWERDVVRTLADWGYEILAMPRALLRPYTYRVHRGTEPTAVGHDFIAVQPDALPDVARRLRTRGV